MMNLRVKLPFWSRKRRIRLKEFDELEHCFYQHYYLCSTQVSVVMTI